MAARGVGRGTVENKTKIEIENSNNIGIMCIFILKLFRKPLE